MFFYQYQKDRSLFVLIETTKPTKNSLVPCMKFKIRSWKCPAILKAAKYDLAVDV